MVQGKAKCEREQFLTFSCTKIWISWIQEHSLGSISVQTHNHTTQKIPEPHNLPYGHSSGQWRSERGTQGPASPPKP